MSRFRRVGGLDLHGTGPTVRWRPTVAAHCASVDRTPTPEETARATAHDAEESDPFSPPEADRPTKHGVSVLERYQRCVYRLLDLFPADPIPKTDPAHTLIERLEALLNHTLLRPVLTTPQPSAVWRCVRCHLPHDSSVERGGCPHCGKAEGCERGGVSRDVEPPVPGVEATLRGLARAAEMIERRDGGTVWDDQVRLALEAYRALVRTEECEPGIIAGRIKRERK